MSQLSLFDRDRPAPERRPPNVPFIRKHLRALLRAARLAQFMPWSEGEALSWEARFPELCKLLPEEEGETLRDAFVAEMIRLRAGR